MTENIPQLKRDLRRILKDRLSGAAMQNLDAANALRDRFLESITLPAGSIIAGYMAKDHEIDPAPLLVALHAKGYKLALPTAGAENRPLQFRVYAPDDELISGSWDIPQPTANAAITEPDIMLIPLLGFDRQGHRLGRGGGHYDRTLADLRVRRKILAIGLALSMQQVPIIPTDSNDARLDKIVTEIEVIQILNHS